MIGAAFPPWHDPEDVQHFARDMLGAVQGDPMPGIPFVRNRGLCFHWVRWWGAQGKNGPLFRDSDPFQKRAVYAATQDKYLPRSRRMRWLKAAAAGDWEAAAKCFRKDVCE